MTRVLRAEKRVFLFKWFKKEVVQFVDENAEVRFTYKRFVCTYIYMYV